MNKNLNFATAIISLLCLVALYAYSINNASAYWDENPPAEYLINNFDKFEGKKIYTGGVIGTADGKFFITQNSIFPGSKKELKIEIINRENFELTDGKYYNFKVKIINEKFYVIEKYSPLADLPFTISALLFNVPAIIIMLFLLLKSKINFKKILIEFKNNKIN